MSQTQLKKACAVTASLSFVQRLDIVNSLPCQSLNVVRQNCCCYFLIKCNFQYLGISPLHISAIIGACSASINEAECEKIHDKESSSAWDSGSTSPSWIVMHLKYPTTLNLIHINNGDLPCTDFGIELEVDGVFVEPLGIEVDLSKYVIKENQIIIPPETKESKIRFSTLKKVIEIEI